MTPMKILTVLELLNNMWQYTQHLRDCPRTRIRPEADCGDECACGLDEVARDYYNYRAEQYRRLGETIEENAE